ncbi:MAG: tyrosine-protein phosphatase [Pseudomonadota bacterium]
MGTKPLDRHVPLTGASNFRDFGGYNGFSGTVKRGLLFRSDRLSRLTSEDFDILRPLDLRLVVDLRRTSERNQEPTRWLGDGEPEHLHAPVFDDHNTPNALLRMAENPQTRTAEVAAETMREVYRHLVSAPASLTQFGGVLQRLAFEQATPVVVHCSGGKDRTGVLAALLLSALGVAWEDIVDDYLLTQQYYDARELLAERSSQILETHGVEMDEAALAPVFAVHPSYLEAARQEAETRHGGVLGLLDAMGVDDAARVRLRDRYLA